MKKIIAMAMALIMTCALAACGGSGTQATAATATGDNAQQTTAAASSGEKIVIKLADVQAENDVETLFEYKFAELVSEKSGGRIEVQVFPAGQMGEMADILTSVQMGSIQMTRTNPSWLADAGVGSINILALPFIFKDLEHANQVLDSDVGKQMLQEIEDKNIQVKGLGYLEPSGRYFFFKNKEVSSLADIKNLKIRVQTNSLATSMVEHLGASATPISYSELYSSLQTGIVDGADNPLKGILNMSFYEVGKYVLDMAHQYEASIIIMNTDFFNKLSAEDQKILQEAMDEGAEYYKQIAEEALDGYRTGLEEKGMVFVTPGDPQEWMDAVQPMYADFSKGYEDVLQQVIDMQK